MSSSTRAPSASPSSRRRVGLALLLLLAFVLRVWNLNWDEGTHQHPDERFWSIVTSQVDWVGPGDYFDSTNSSLNPYNHGPTFVYGTLPLFTTKAAAGVLEDVPIVRGPVVSLADAVGIDLKTEIATGDGGTSNVNAFDTEYNVNLVGRLLAALIDTGTVLLVYLLGRELFDRRVGFVAATLATFAPLHIQYSHFHGAEPWVTFFVAAAILTSIRMYRRYDRYGGFQTESPRSLHKYAVGTGVLAGLAMASKIIGAVVLLVPAAAIALVALPTAANIFRLAPQTSRQTARATLISALVSIGALAIFAQFGVDSAASDFMPFYVGLVALALLVAAYVIIAGLRRAAEAAPAKHLFDIDADQAELVLPDRAHGPSLTRVGHGVIAGVLVLVGAAVTFRWFQPYSFDGLFSFDERYSQDIDYINDVNSGGGYPWVFQWIGRTPLLFPLKSAFWWGMGPALAIAVILGIGRAIGDVVRRRRWLMVLPLIFITVMLALVSQQFNPLIRYMLPAYPIAIALAGNGVVSLWDSGRSRLERGVRSNIVSGRAMQGAALALVAVTAFWGLAFVNGVYNTEHPRLEASRWMAENLPADAVVSSQAWDDALPLFVSGTEGYQPPRVELQPFTPDRAIDQNDGISKIDRFLDGLDQVDYIVESSNKLYGAIPRIPAKYPAMVAYYDALFDGRLGFEQIAQFQNAPNLFGVRIDTANAEETFTVYDHPTVTIWQKTDAYSRDRAVAILNPARAEVAVDIAPRDASTNALQMDPDTAANLRTGETFNESFNKDGITGKLTWLWWLGWLQISALALLPWTTLLFSRLPDKGYGLSKVAGFGFVGMVTWSLVSWGAIDFGRGVSIGVLGFTLALGVAGWVPSRKRMRTLARDHAALWTTAELVFLAVFGFVLFLRTQNPDLWHPWRGGEKPMELAYLTAISRTQELPAYDPWFAGGYMNYYYLGWFFLAVPIRALRVLPEVGFQLGVATYAALATTTVFSIVANLVSLSRKRLSNARLHDPRNVFMPGPRPAIWAGLTSAVLFIGIGNLDALRQHQRRLDVVNPWDTKIDLPLIGGIVDPIVNNIITFVGGTWAWATGAELPRFDFWAPSRINTPIDGQVIDITEFPYFTYLFGDLHPHMMGMTFVGLCIALTLTLVVAADHGARTQRVMAVVLLGITTGVVRAVNTWDYPTVMILAAAATAASWIVSPDPAARLDHGEEAAHVERNRRRFGLAVLVGAAGLAIGASRIVGQGSLLVYAVLAAGGVLAIASLLFPDTIRQRVLGALGHLGLLFGVHTLALRPFLRNSETFDTGIDGATFSSPTGDFVAHWGVFIALTVALFLATFLEHHRSFRERLVARRSDVDDFESTEERALGADGQPADRRKALPQFGPTLVRVGAIVMIWAVARAEVNGPFAIAAVGAAIALALFVRELRNTDPDIGALVAFGLIALACGIGGGPEIITIENDISRMNTVFKFWLQSWQLLAIAGGYAAWRVGHVLAQVPVERRRRSDMGMAAPESRTKLRRSWATVVVLLILPGLAYPLLATGPRLADRFNSEIDPTLDGLAYLDADPILSKRDEGQDGPETTVALAQDLPLIEWLRENVEGSPTVVEWSGALYDWNGRIAIHTGLPAVLGWDWHQKQQRWDYGPTIDERRNEVQRFYTQADTEFVTTFLQRYEVGYVVIGTQEQRHGDQASLAIINGHPALTEVFRTGDKTIYEVNVAALWPGIDEADLDQQAID